MGTAAQYEALAWQVAQQEFPDNPQMAQTFFNMIKQESGFSPDVVEGRRVSSAGAAGIAQLMPSEIASAKAKNPNFSEFNAEQALRHGADILRFNYNYFKGDITKAAAAYNAGCGGVDNAVAKGGASWVSALPGETQSYVSIVFGGQTQGTEGGVTMAGEPKTNSVAQTRIDNMLAQADKLFATGLASDAIAGQALVESAATLAKVYGLGLADTGTATTTTTIPSAQETATGQWDMETWLYDAQVEWDAKGPEIATQNFVNKLNAAQEGRLEATAAQEYAMNLAPPGMTELKLAGWDKGLPLGGYMPSTYAGAMGQTNVPQAPELQMPQRPAVPQMPNLGALSSQQTSTQIQTPIGALPTDNLGGGQAGANSSYMQAIRNVMQRMGGILGAGATGGNLPVG